MGFLDEIISMRVKPKHLRYISLDSLRVMILNLTYLSGLEILELTEDDMPVV